jgi:hypothetical protein
LIVIINLPAGVSVVSGLPASADIGALGFNGTFMLEVDSNLSPGSYVFQLHANPTGADNATGTGTLLVNAPTHISSPGPDATIACPQSPVFIPPTSTNGTVSEISDITVPGNCAGTYSRTKSWKATGICGDSSTVSQMITVADATPPAITCASNRVVECSEAWDFDVATASDTCDTNVLVTYADVTNALCGATFSATRTWLAVDACGNSNSCSQTITVVVDTRHR